MSQLDLLADLIGRARRAGADAADALIVTGTLLSVQRRLGRTEHLERAEGRDLGLRVFLGRRSAIVSSSSADPAGFDALVERAVAMARVVPEDPYAGLADDMRPYAGANDLDLDGTPEPEAEALIRRASRAEDAARAQPGVTNAEADAEYRCNEIALATSAGFAGAYVRTSHAVSATAFAGTGTGMQRDYDHHETMHLSDLDDAEAIGRSAAERALARLNPARPRTARLPVIYDPRVAGSLLGHLSSAVNGASIVRGTSFLKDAMGTRVFAPGIAIHDDPCRPRSRRSRPFDGEGVPSARRAVIEDGVLATWLLDSRSARQLGLRSTGHASRDLEGPPSPAATNLSLAAGTATPAELMADIREGLYLTELIGSGINGLTGDYSRGAAGFMIRDGAVAEPVAEITVAGNLRDMFRALVPANDLVLRRGFDSPTVRVDGLTMAGS